MYSNVVSFGYTKMVMLKSRLSQSPAAVPSDFRVIFFKFKFNRLFAKLFNIDRNFDQPIEFDGKGSAELAMNTFLFMNKHLFIRHSFHNPACRST